MQTDLNYAGREGDNSVMLKTVKEVKHLLMSKRSYVSSVFSEEEAESARSQLK